MKRSFMRTPGPMIEAMPQDDSQIIDQIRLFDLHFDATGNDFGFFFDQSIAKDINPTRFDSIASEVWPVTNSTNLRSAEYEKISGRPARRRVDLSLLAPRAIAGSTIKIARKCMYIIRLKEKRGSAGIEWRYSRGFSPFSVGGTRSEVGTLSKIFKNSCLIYPDSRIVATSELPPPYDETKVAAFVFDHDSFGTAAKVEPFNIHVEVRGRKNAPGHQSDQFHGYIPIIIDPDVGHPGGSFPPPPPGP